MKELLYNLLYEGTGQITMVQTLESMLVALVLVLLVYVTYQVTYSGVVYSRKFNISLVMLTMITTIIMNIIGSSIALSLGMVGALSIVRFRTAIKDPRDTAYIFWAISIGLGAGSMNFMVTAVGTVITAVMCLILNIAIKTDERYLIIIRCSCEVLDSVRATLFNTYRASKLRSETITEDFVEIVHQIKLKKSDDLKEYEGLRKLDGVISVNIIAQSGETLG